MVEITVDWEPKRRKLLVRFPFDEAALEHLRNAPDRTFDSVSRAWVMAPALANVQYLNQWGNLRLTPPAAHVFRKINEEEKNAEYNRTLSERDDLSEKYLDYTPKTQPFKHQIQAFNLAKMRDSYALFFEQGLGKTKTSIDLASYWMETGEIDRVLVLCPSFVKTVWPREIETHATVNNGIAVINASQGDRRRQLVAQYAKKRGVWLVVNYEEIISSVGPVFQGYVNSGKVLIIADESTKIKNRAAKTTRQAVALAKCSTKRLILNGTPISNSPLDFWSQFRFMLADLGFTDFVSFRNHIADMGGFQMHEVLRYKNLEDLQRRISGFSIRRTKEQCLDLPEKLFQVVEVELPKEVKEAYNQMYEEMVVELTDQADQKGEVAVTNVLAKMQKLAQICGSTLKMEDGTVTYFKARPKLDALMDLLLEEISPDKQVVVWSRYIAEIKMISEALTKAGISHSLNYGETSQADRLKNVDRFQGQGEFKDKPRDRVFVAQPQAAALGITLTAASYVIYFSNDFSYYLRAQSEDRTHRIGTVGNVTYMDILAKDTIDEVVHEVLASKKSMADYILDNKTLPAALLKKIV